MKAEIIEIHNDAITAKIISTDNCNKKCGACTGCGGLFGKPQSEKNILLKPENFSNVANLKTGDIIDFEFKDKYYILTAALIFFIPSIVALLSLIFLISSSIDQRYAVLLTLTIVLIYYVSIRKLIRKISESIKIRT